jgi:DNA-binding response OmpR family regulator
MRIYVVEDEPITAKIITSVLAGAGHEVQMFEDGEKAWAAFDADPVPLVVTDWMMPRMSGLELCRKIRQTPGIPYTNVIIVTSLALSEHTVDAYNAGVDDLLGKPLDATALLRRVAVTERGQLAQAEHALRKCLDICQRSLGPEHAALLEALESLAEVSRRQRSYVRCRAFIRRQLDIASASFGESDGRTKALRSDLEELTSIEDRL